ncbi:MAG: hydroxymethylbilane synthase [Syntrophobacterales bacterium]|nr:hydroxymethylbilane synthase [Syntrophobacterales bacterium]
MPRTLRIGTRGSVLALTQSRWVEAQLRTVQPEVATELVVIKTSGDRITDVPLARLGGKGLFIKEIEEALLRGEVDLAVHSLKDMPAELPPGCVLGAFPPREDWRDAFLSHRWESLADIPPGGRVGTGSLRRRVQVLRQRPDLEVVPLRGNVDTRLRKLATENLDAIILAAAGLKRLGLGHLPRRYLGPQEMLPAIGQGALALEVRAEDRELLQLLAPLDHYPTRVAVTAERAFLARLEGGCLVPVAALGELTDGRLSLTALISDADGRQVVQDRLIGDAGDAAALGAALAERLLAAGGREILAAFYEGPD